MLITCCCGELYTNNNYLNPEHFKKGEPMVTGIFFLISCLNVYTYSF